MKVYLVGRQHALPAVEEFLKDEGLTHTDSALSGGAAMVELGGRLCYMSFGKGRKTHTEYVANLLEKGHGSVLEHAVWNFIITGVSRNCTHELIRHRHFSVSELSQRYVDLTNAPMHTEGLGLTSLSHLQVSRGAYIHEQTKGKMLGKPTKDINQLARKVLPGCIETKIFVTANARALRHFFVARGSVHADPEIRALAAEWCEKMKVEDPNLFGDFTITDGIISSTYGRV